MKLVRVKRLQTADCIQGLNKPAFFEYYIIFYFKLQFMMDGIIIIQSSATNIPFFFQLFSMSWLALGCSSSYLSQKEIFFWSRHYCCWYKYHLNGISAKPDYVIYKAKLSRIKSLQRSKHFSGNSYWFCLIFYSHIEACHLSTETLCEEYVRMIIPRKVLLIYQMSLPSKKLYIHETIMRDISLILNEFRVATLWFMCNN